VNYRHIFHAANFADVLKHVVLVHVLERLTAKNKPICVIDTHAGAGAYDLGSATARRSGEAEGGFARIAGKRDLPPPIARYAALVREFSRKFGDPPGTIVHYPGSPRLARAVLRPGDRLVVCELHIEQARLLKREFAGDRQVDVRHEDGYALLKSLLPPKERRGLVLIDPPYEARDELTKLARHLLQAHRRFATGAYLVWYPIKDQQAAAAFRAAIAGMGWAQVLDAAIAIGPVAADGPLNACGLLLINPPWRSEAMLKAVLPYLAEALAAKAGKWSLNWLAAEHAPPASESDPAPAAGTSRR
jgi:23S rRNA (adenine2030-N6)-methyltransferase